MSQQVPEGTPESTEGGLNPAWADLLNELPDELHTIVKPHLSKWDKGLQDKIREVQSQYDGLDAYKDFAANGVDPKYLEGAVMLAQQFKDNPDAVIEQAVKAYNLEHWQKANQQQTPGTPTSPEYDPEEWGGIDITKHPVVQQLEQQVQSLTQDFQSSKQEDEQAEAEAAYLAELEAAHKGPNGEDVHFSDMYVTALVTQGVSLPDAIKSYQDEMKSAVGSVVTPPATQTEQPPVVMGAAGTVGTGTPEQAVKPGDMSDGNIQDLVINILKKAEEQ